MMIVDRRTLFLLSFNFVHLDIDHSRGFGLVSTNSKVVQEAIRLFDADLNRQTYTGGLKAFIVSPVECPQASFRPSSRRRSKQLLIYDPKIADKHILRLLEEHAKAGVDVKIIGSVGARNSNLPVTPLTSMRLHTRTIIRDGSQAFVGSQSLRPPELDPRREIGIIVRRREGGEDAAHHFRKRLGLHRYRRDSRDGENQSRGGAADQRQRPPALWRKK